MTTRLGLEVLARELRIVMVRGGVVGWTRRVECGPNESLAEVVRRILADVPKARFSRPKLRVALGAARAQVRHLEGLPVLANRTHTTQLVRENTSALFLRSSAPVAIPDVCRGKDGTLWGAALERATIDEVVAGARGAKVSVVTILPSVVALAQLALPAPVVHSDGDTCFQVESVAGELRSLARRTVISAPATVPAPLQAIGEDAPLFLGAYAAALVPQRAPLSWRPEMERERTVMLRRARMVACAVLLAAAAAAALSAPAVRASLYVRGGAAELASLRGVELEASRAESELRRVTQLLDGVTAFEADRGHVTRLLGDLSQAIPESTAIVTLRVDSLEGSFSAVAPHVTDVLSELADVHEMSAVRISGSVTREVLAGTHLERATFRFRRARPKPRVATTAGAGARPGAVPGVSP